MDLADKKIIINLLKTQQKFARKSLGQNFLVDQTALDNIVDAADIKSTDHILEIGSGFGTLTQALAQRVIKGKVIAIEKDEQLFLWLDNYFEHYKNVEIINGDILTTRLGYILKSPYKLVANIPYSLTSPILTKFLLGDYRKRSQEKSALPISITMLVQKEVAERLAAPPGNSERGILTVLVELFGRLELKRIVKATSFYPAPKVDSAIIHLECHRPAADPNHFYQIVKAGFANKRRMLHNSLSGSLRISNEEARMILEKAHINSLLRAEQLTLEQWLKLYQTIRMLINI